MTIAQIALSFMFTVSYLTAASGTHASVRCTCRGGKAYEKGMVSYGRNSDMQVITRIEATDVDRQEECASASIRSTEIHPHGSSYDFSLVRSTIRESTIDPCVGSVLATFRRRDNAYSFVLDKDSYSIREMLRGLNPASSAKAPADSRSNANLLESINVDRTRTRTHDLNVGNPYNRASWVLTLKDIRGHLTEIQDDPVAGDRIALSQKTSIVKGGQLGQIEAVIQQYIIVRFYLGSRVERFGPVRNSFRRWYDKIGGPYESVEDELFTRNRAEILAVSPEQIAEVNDYLDTAHVENTRRDSPRVQERTERSGAPRK